jgi:hypothetical protein
VTFSQLLFFLRRASLGHVYLLKDWIACGDFVEDKLKLGLVDEE